jgi:hypothetical protein
MTDDVKGLAGLTTLAVASARAAADLAPSVQNSDGDWRRFIAIRCHPEPSLYTSIWSQRRSETAAPEQVR